MHLRAILLAFFYLVPMLGAAEKPVFQPNIRFILADDLGCSEPLSPLAPIRSPTVSFDPPENQSPGNRILRLGSWLTRSMELLVRKGRWCRVGREKTVKP
jgi:hypothetical protein